MTVTTFVRASAAVAYMAYSAAARCHNGFIESILTSHSSAAISLMLCWSLSGCRSIAYIYRDQQYHSYEMAKIYPWSMPDLLREYPCVPAEERRANG